MDERLLRVARTDFAPRRRQTKGSTKILAFFFTLAKEAKQYALSHIFTSSVWQTKDKACTPANIFIWVHETDQGHQDIVFFLEEYNNNNNNNIGYSAVKHGKTHRTTYGAWLYEAKLTRRLATIIQASRVWRHIAVHAD